MAEQGDTGGTARGGGGAEGAAPDIEALSEKVYRLLLAELRLDAARAGRGPGRG
jgi:hypothetical protein